MKICAESQLDDPNAKFGTVAAIAQFVKDGTVVKDADAIDLLEWATGDLTDEEDFVQTLGPLRVRCVKASPKDKINATRCLMSCLLHWDLESAQQVSKAKNIIFHVVDICPLDRSHYRQIRPAREVVHVLEHCHHPYAFGA